MKAFITGVHGQLGHDAALEFMSRGHIAVGCGTKPEAGNCPCEYTVLDICDADAVMRTLTRVAPDEVVHCAAWTAVDAAERAENREKVRAINVHGTENIARACAECGAKLIFISSDYVFPGTGDSAWAADCRDFAPCNFYGQTKLDGERIVSILLERYFIVRTSWLYGINGTNFVKTMLRLGETHSTLRVVDDQIGTPTYSRDLARLLADMAEGERYGVYNASNEGGYISWCDFARAIFARAGLDVRVDGVTTAEYGAEAVRPLNSRFDKSKLAARGFAPLPTWEDALERFLSELAKTEEQG